MSDLLAHLLTLLEDGSSKLPAVTRRKMFGCEALFADQNIFSLVWKSGRIGLKLPDAAQFDELMALPGAEPWSPGGKMKMSHWVLVPERFHDDTDTLDIWIERAHGAAVGGESPKKKAPAAKKKAPVAKKKAPVAR